MTEEKKKAKEIVGEYKRVFELLAHKDYLNDYAKTCALIHVDGIIEEVLIYGESRNRWEFWRAVEKQIEKL